MCIMSIKTATGEEGQVSAGAEGLAASARGKPPPVPVHPFRQAMIKPLVLAAAFV